MGGERKSALTGQAGDQLVSGLKFGRRAVECVPNRLGAAAEMTREKRFHHSTECQAVFLSNKTVAFTHKRTNHELIRPCARYRAQRPRPVRPFPRVKAALGLALAKSRRSSMRFVPENQVRTRLPAGGRWIRTFGSRTRHQTVRPRRGRFPVIGSSPHWPGGTGISNIRP